MTKIKQEGQAGEYIHYCPGCNCLHMINTAEKNSWGAIWSFDMNFEKPTFHPSVNLGPARCHYNITNGLIIFHPDCTHSFAGQTIELPQIPADY